MEKVNPLLVDYSAKADDQNDQLNQTLLSHAAESDLSNIDSAIQGSDQTQNQENKEKEEYNDYQVPASLALAQLHWDSTGIGRIPEGVKEEDLEQCPCCLNFKLEQFPRSTDPLTIRGFGSSIPLFYLFIHCARTLLFIEYLGVFYLGIVFREIVCINLKKNSGQECSLFDLETYKFPNIWKNLESEGVKGKLEIALLICLFSISLMYVVIFWFSKKKVKLRFACKDDVEKAMVKEFIIMVEGVDGNDPRGLEPVHQFISELMEKQGFPQPTVAKAVLAKATGKIDRVRKQLKDSREELETIKHHTDHLVPNKIERIEKWKRNCIENIKKTEKKNINNLEKKLEKLKKNQIIENRKNRKSVAFISYQTNIERDHVLMAFDHQYTHFYSFLLPRPLYKISPAKQPASIIWDNVGHSRCDEILRSCIARPLLFLLTLDSSSPSLYSTTYLRSYTRT